MLTPEEALALLSATEGAALHGFKGETLAKARGKLRSILEAEPEPVDPVAAILLEALSSCSVPWPDALQVLASRIARDVDKPAVRSAVADLVPLARRAYYEARS